MPPFAVILAVLLTFVVGFAPRASAQPDDVTRTLRTFDFEERRLGNVEELPMHWAKVRGEGLPHYVNGRFDTSRKRGGAYSFRFELNGGSLVYRYESGHIRVQPGAHYRVEGWCQTTVLSRARARLTAYLADIDGNPIPGSTRHSELYAAKTDDEPWRPLSVELSAESPLAAFLVLELGLLQPAQYESHPPALGERALHTQDIRGVAWFDDVSVSQVPRVTLTTDRPGNIFRRGEPLRLQVLVNDRFTDDLAAQLVISDAIGKTVYQRSGALDMESARTIAPGQKRMTLDLPALKPGWYDAALVMSSQGKFVGRQSLQLIHLADSARPAPTDHRFGLIATELPFAGWEQLPDLLPLLSAGRVKLAVWSKDGDIEQMEAGAFDRILERLAERGITPTACLLDVPPRIADKLVNDRSTQDLATAWPRLLKTDPAVWRPELAYLVSRHANHLDRWQLGADGTDAFVTHPVMRQVYGAVYREFRQLVDRPDLAMPWPAWYDLNAQQLPATIALSVPPSVLPSQLPLYIQESRVKGPGKASSDSALSPQPSALPPGTQHSALSITLQLLDRDRYGREVQIRDLAQRVVYALAAGAERIDLPLPFTVQSQGAAVVQQPKELLMIVRTLTTMLSGTVYRGKVPIADGVEAFLFERDGQGILAVWDRGNAPAGDVGAPAAGQALPKNGLRELVLNLGERPVSVDLWGNATPLPKPPGGDGIRGDGRVAVTVGQMPVFLVDVDGYMAQLRASVALDRPLLESSFQPHARKLRFTNPYRQAIAGMVKVKAPKGWTINPPTVQFSLNPGEQFDKDLTIEFPYNSFAGAKNLQVEFMLQGEGGDAFTVPLTVRLGLSDVGMQTIALRDGADIVVQQMISNYGDKPIDYSSFAIFPGQARQERLVTNLGPGRTTVKKYRFKDVKIEGEAKVRVGVKELDGTRILNEEVPVQ